MYPVHQKGRYGDMAIMLATPSTRRSSVPRQAALAAVGLLALIWCLLPLMRSRFHYASDDGNIAATGSIAPPASSKPSQDRTLILYAYSDSPTARSNLAFFLREGLHGGADFVFIINGATTTSSPPSPNSDPDDDDDEDDDPVSSIPTSLPNVRVVRRPNTCFDLGAYGEVLRSAPPGRPRGATGEELWRGYGRFVLLNASLRGPFLPQWSRGCWSDLYLSRLTGAVKLVGMTANCWPRFHVQSMVWATDALGLAALLAPPAGAGADDEFGAAADPVGLAGCYDGWRAAVHAEIGATAAVRAAGYEVDVVMTAFHGIEDYEGHCDASQNGDVLHNGRYFGTNVHPYETVFIKANRDIDPVLLDRLTSWHLSQGRGSWDACKGL